MKKETKKPELVEIEEKEVLEKVKPIELIAEELKKKHKLKEVFITDIAGEYVIWRKLKRSEYKEAMTQKFNENEDLAYYERQDFVAAQVILYPENAEELIEEFAGISDIIATETMVKTGFGLTTTQAV